MAETIEVATAKGIPTLQAETEPLSKSKSASKDYSVYNPISLLRRLKQIKAPSSELVSAIELRRPRSLTSGKRAETLPDCLSSNDAPELRDPPHLDRGHEATSNPTSAVSIHESDAGTKQDRLPHTYVIQAQGSTHEQVPQTTTKAKSMPLGDILPEENQSQSGTPPVDNEQQDISIPVAKDEVIECEIARARDTPHAVQSVSANNEVSSSDVERNTFSASVEAPARSHANTSPPQGTTRDSEMRETPPQLVEIEVGSSIRLKKLGPGVSLLGKGCHQKMTGDYYIAPGQEIPMSSVRHWANIIVPLLRHDIIAILDGIAKKRSHAAYQSRFHIGFYMVGAKQEDSIIATPGIVIFYTARNSLGKLAKALAESKKDYLEDFPGPIQVVHEDLTETPRLAASGQAGVSSTPSLQDVAIECPMEHCNTDCGLKLRFDDDHQQSRYATLGGIICIEDIMYVMTTAHTLFSETDGSRSQYDVDSSHPSIRSAKAFQPLRPELGASASLVAYSFNDQVSKIDGTLSFPHTDSDWALLPIADSLLLPNMNAGYEINSTAPDSTGMTISVSILCGVYTCYTGHLTQSPVILDLGACGMITREILLDRPLPSGVSGSWVVDCSELHGYVVAVDARGHSCFMIPMDRAFRDITATFSENMLFGTALNQRIRQGRRRSRHASPMRAEPLKSEIIDSEMIDSKMLNPELDASAPKEKTRGKEKDYGIEAEPPTRKQYRSQGPEGGKADLDEVLSQVGNILGICGIALKISSVISYKPLQVILLSIKEAISIVRLAWMRISGLLHDRHPGHECERAILNSLMSTAYIFSHLSVDLLQLPMKLDRSSMFSVRRPTKRSLKIELFSHLNRIEIQSSTRCPRSSNLISSFPSMSRYRRHRQRIQDQVSATSLLLQVM